MESQRTLTPPLRVEEDKVQRNSKWVSCMDPQKLADWWSHSIVHSQGEGKSSANPQLMEGRMSRVCSAHCGLRCLRPEQLFQGQLRVRRRCMAGALQLSRGLLSVLYLIPQWVINKLLLITMGAVKDPLSSLLPTAAFGTAPLPCSPPLLSQWLSQSRWDQDSRSILWTVNLTSL